MVGRQGGREDIFNLRAIEHFSHIVYIFLFMC